MLSQLLYPHALPFNMSDIGVSAKQKLNRDSVSRWNIALLMGMALVFMKVSFV